jgi:V8-like Glu-specific endopeptidase
LVALVDGPTELSNNELLVFGVDHRLSFDFIDGAHRAARAVARLQVTLPDAVVYGTAWLCGRDLLMTNRHVLAGDRAATDAELQDRARRAVAWFDYRIESGSRVEMTSAALRWSDDKLDCAILELPAGASDGRVPLPSSRSAAQLDRGARLNIPQHPRGGPIRFAIRSNYYTTGNEMRGVMRYVTDTESGSSGSPVCDDTWTVVALHARAAPIAPQAFPDGTAHYVNEGIAIDRIRAALPRDIADRLA